MCITKHTINASLFCYLETLCDLGILARSLNNLISQLLEFFKYSMSLLMFLVYQAIAQKPSGLAVGAKKFCLEYYKIPILFKRWKQLKTRNKAKTQRFSSETENLHNNMEIAKKQ